MFALRLEQLAAGRPQTNNLPFKRRGRVCGGAGHHGRWCSLVFVLYKQSSSDVFQHSHLTRLKSHLDFRSGYIRSDNITYTFRGTCLAEQDCREINHKEKRTNKLKTVWDSSYHFIDKLSQGSVYIFPDGHCDTDVKIQIVTHTAHHVYMNT